MEEEIEKRSEARIIKIPNQSFTIIEYPGLIKNLNKAIKTLGGLNLISKGLLNSNEIYNNIELNLNNNNNNNNNKLNFNQHPIQSNLSLTGNILIKIIKRKRKIPLKNEKGEIIEEGFYTFNSIGIINRSVRFRGMADFQHIPIGIENDPMVQIANSVRAMNVEAIQDFKFNAPNENFDKEIWIPPPTFSRHVVPQVYDYRPLNASIKVPSQRKEGEERLVNNTRWQGFPTQTILFSNPLPPSGPVKDLVEKLKLEAKPVVEILKKLLEKRPVWTRSAICNQLDDAMNRVIINQKQAFPMVSWSFSDGPYRDLVIRFGYDPRTDPSARFYQHIVLRNADNVRSKRTAVNPVTLEKEVVNRLSHTFDGTQVHSKVGNFQLEDISDPLLFSIIHSPTAYNSICSQEAEGWYKREIFDLIRLIMRRKFMGLLNGVKVTDEDCRDLLVGRKDLLDGEEGDDNDEHGEGGEEGGKKGKGSAAIEEESEDEDEDEEEEEENDTESMGTPMDQDIPTSGDDQPSTSTSNSNSKSKPKKLIPSTSTSTTRRGSKITSTRAPWEEKKQKYQKAKPKAINSTANAALINSGGIINLEETAEAKAIRLRKIIGLVPTPIIPALPVAIPVAVPGSGERQGQGEASGSGSGEKKKTVAKGKVKGKGKK